MINITDNNTKTKGKCDVDVVVMKRTTVGSNNYLPVVVMKRTTVGSNNYYLPQQPLLQLSNATHVPLPPLSWCWLPDMDSCAE